MVESKMGVKERYDHTSASKTDKYLDPTKRRWYCSLFGTFVVEAIEEFERTTGSIPTHVLDVGTGAGIVPFFLDNEARTVVGVDISETAVRTASHQLGNSRRSFALADAERLPFEDRSFDFTTALGTFEHVEDLTPVIDEMTRILSDDGGIVLQIHNARDLQLSAWRDRHEYDRYAHSIETVESVLDECGVDLVRYETSHFALETQKILFNTEQVPDPIRKFVATGSALCNRLCRRLPWLRERGGVLLVYGQKRTPEL